MAQGEVHPEPVGEQISDDVQHLHGRKIAVNRNYYCYQLNTDPKIEAKSFPIHISRAGTRSKSTLQGHNQKVFDMAFFAEEVDLLASACVGGLVSVRKIDGEKEKPRISEQIILTLQILVDEEMHPRVCWHPSKQHFLMVAIGKSILRIDTTEVGSGGSKEKPIITCSIEKLRKGVKLVGTHDREVTDLTMVRALDTRLASASLDGTVKIWVDSQSPIAVLRPYGGKPVGSVAFLRPFGRPTFINLITTGHLNGEIKLWATPNEPRYWFSKSELWSLLQTKILTTSSAASGSHCSGLDEDDDAFLAVALPWSSMFLLANLKMNAIYACRIEYGQCPKEARIGLVTRSNPGLPILGLAAIRADRTPSVEQQKIHVFCVHTQSVQAYELGVFQPQTR